jgi:hypothetical protein
MCQVSSRACSSFSPIAGDPGAVVLVALDNALDAIEDVDLPFNFSWLGAYNVDVVRVSTHGFINVDKDNTPNAGTDEYCDGPPGPPGGCPPFEHASWTFSPQIAVVHEDLNTQFNGTVYTLYVTSPEEAFVISWEGVAFYEYDATNDIDTGHGSVNAQAVLYPNGSVELRWGTVVGGSNDVVMAGIIDPTALGSVTLPATVCPFGLGMTPKGSFPNNACQDFAFSSITSSPTPFVTCAPTPTPPPTLAPSASLFCTSPSMFNESALVNHDFGVSTCGDFVAEISVILPGDCAITDALALIWRVASACCLDNVANTACGGPEVQSVCQDPADFIPDALIDGGMPCWTTSTLDAYPIMAVALVDGCDGQSALPDLIVFVSEFCCEGGVSAHNPICDPGT